MYDQLWSAYGPQGWWPTCKTDLPRERELPSRKLQLARAPARACGSAARCSPPSGLHSAEIVVGAILTQNTAWTNVERAIENLNGANALDFSVLRDLPEPELAELIRPSGTYRVKARRLKAFVERLWESHNGSLEDMLAGEIEVARRRLLNISGIGPETADAILLYAGNRPSFVVDAYTMRILRRHFIVSDEDDYESVRAGFHDALPHQTELFNEYHALLVEVGKRHCRVRARCAGCPLDVFPHLSA